MVPTSSRKAIALLSGGLDSALAARMIKDQGVEVVGLHLLSPFGCKEEVQKVADSIGIPLKVKEKGESYLDLVQNPRYGYGRNMNPCIDCRIFMFQLADVVRQDEKADFVVTGEVLGQRPMSQQRNSMNTIDKQSPLGDLLVRPLSAHHFDPSLPEREGWINRDLLLNISGRGRKDQIKLAETYGINFFSSPAGGCLLTDANFSRRLKDFFEVKNHQTADERMAQAAMLRLGRHFRFTDKSKAIVARNHVENLEMRRLWEKSDGTLVAPKNFNGPIGIVFGEATNESVDLTAQLIARYGKSSEKEEFEFTRESLDGTSESFTFQTKIESSKLEQYII